MEWSELLANQLHDLKNQLGVLMQQIDTGDLEQLPAMQQSSRLIHDDLNGVLMLYRMQQEQFRLDRMDLPLCDVPQEAVARHLPLLERAGITVTIDCDVHAYGFYDRPLLVSVMAHGLLNAIHADASQILFSATREEGGACFTLDDDGVGLGNLKGAERAEEGSGIGLVLGRAIAAAHQRAGHEGVLSLQASERLNGAQLKLWIPG